MDSIKEVLKKYYQMILLKNVQRILQKTASNS
jgi:hypothetical protein